MVGQATTLDDLVDRGREALAAGGHMILRTAEVAAFVAATSRLAVAAKIADELAPTVDITRLDPRIPFIFAQVYVVGGPLTVAKAAELGPPVLKSVSEAILAAVEREDDRIVQPPCDVEHF